MASKVNWSLPGCSTESRERKIANSTRMIATTRISMVIQFSHGCAGSAAGWPSPARNEASGPARKRLNRTVVQTSASACINEFVDDFEDYRRARHQQPQ